ncbi:MAG: hypothetical protein F6K40_21960 [Okeania sp. SIO3I5]|uniref:hypothetical protein n=1 Tax=Okeania sp. SIO3I5 TaxID=2607805 RepID=UPI0013B6C84B|nr:hypothetical protein [Okeania sp. SIO3I5]NEQ38789.1 hypothetical protein [Okeania sp. SIO3I5]
MLCNVPTKLKSNRLSVRQSDRPIYLLLNHLHILSFDNLNQRSPNRYTERSPY